MHIASTCNMQTLTANKTFPLIKKAKDYNTKNMQFML